MSFFSNITRKELRKTYCEAEIAIIPSLYEGFGFAAIEAMACGVPLISTSGGAFLRLSKIQNYNSTKNSKEIYNSIELLLSSSGLASQLALKASERVKSKFLGSNCKNWKKSI